MKILFNPYRGRSTNRGETLKNFMDYHNEKNSAATVLTAVTEDTAGLGRIIKDEKKKDTF